MRTHSDDLFCTCAAYGTNAYGHDNLTKVGSDFVEQFRAVEKTQNVQQCPLRRVAHILYTLKHIST